MIACFGKNERGAHLFAALAQLDRRFVDLGVVRPSRRAHLAGLVSSVAPSIPEMKREARFSPPFLQGTTDACVELLQGKQVEEVLYWGATNLPVAPSSSIPFSIVTDGPFDPNDPSYPVEWKPRRWEKQYLATQRTVFERAKHVFTLSEWARQKILTVHGLPPEKVTKCGWGPLGCFYPPRLDASPGTKLILSVGSDWRRKGMDLVAEAGAILHAEDPSVQTVIAGVPGDLRIAPRPGVSLLATNTPAPVIHTLMRAARCLVVAARFDASPHVIYEALQYGTPVVGTNVCGVPEAIDAPHGGVVAESPDAPSLVHALRTLLQSDESECRMNARRTFIESGRWEASAEVVLARLKPSE